MEENLSERHSNSKRPFERLVETPTASSLARKIATRIPRCPPDSLDLALASTYDHHSVWGAARSTVVRQEKSCVVDHAEEFRKHLGISKVEDRSSNEQFNWTESKASYRNDSFHVHRGIPPHHGANSRRGFGRSSDGSFYTS